MKEKRNLKEPKNIDILRWKAKEEFEARQEQYYAHYWKD